MSNWNNLLCSPFFFFSMTGCRIQKRHLLTPGLVSLWWTALINHHPKRDFKIIVPLLSPQTLSTTGYLTATCFFDTRAPLRKLLCQLVWRLVAVPSALYKSHSRNQAQEAAQNERSRSGYIDSRNAHGKSDLPQAFGLIVGGSCNSRHEIHTAVTVIINKQVKFVYLRNLEKCPIQSDGSAQPGSTSTHSSQLYGSP